MSKFYREGPLMFGDDFWRFLGRVAVVVGALSLVGCGTLVYGVYRLLT